eukprot:GILI01011428.1.p2 GENE.GILI01011428.1~~GILI01011428.1.p2  ORF type:complete len:124 (+),score=29.58 GILI01011428.1:105-476(+)
MLRQLVSQSLAVQGSRSFGTHVHKVSIKFIGKRTGQHTMPIAPSSPLSSSTSTSSTSSSKPAAQRLSFSDLPAAYARKFPSQDEISAINEGGLMESYWALNLVPAPKPKPVPSKDAKKGDKKK